jgi:pimeloyl-ACP methyl ester carboxylesterase
LIKWYFTLKRSAFITLVHGHDDHDVPLSEARKLKSVAPSNAEWFEVAGVGHDLRPAIAELSYRVSDFVRAALPAH